MNAFFDDDDEKTFLPKGAFFKFNPESSMRDNSLSSDAGLEAAGIRRGERDFKDRHDGLLKWG